jgi:hypothetical protein
LLVHPWGGEVDGKLTPYPIYGSYILLISSLPNWRVIVTYLGSILEGIVRAGFGGDGEWSLPISSSISTISSSVHAKQVVSSCTLTGHHSAGLSPLAITHLLGC